MDLLNHIPKSRLLLTDIPYDGVNKKSNGIRNNNYFNIAKERIGE